MTPRAKQTTKHIMRNKILDRELDFLPSTVNRDDVREIARRYGPQRRHSAPVRFMGGAFDFFARYSAPFVGLLAGAEYAAARALYPLIGEEERFGDALRLYLGEELGRKAAEMSKAFEVTGALVAATPKIVTNALYGALIGIGVYYAAKWTLVLSAFLHRRARLKRKVSQLLA
jgi:hypothetical protein